MYRKAPAKLRFRAKVCVSNLHRFSDWDWTLSFFPTAIYFVSACGKCNLLLFKILKKELSKKLSRLNDNLMKDLVSTNFAGNKPCRKREMQGLWRFVATWESPDAGGSPGVCALLWLLNSRRAYPCIAGTQRPQPWTWESVVSKCLVTLLARVNFIEIFLSSPLLFSSNWYFIKKILLFSSRHSDSKMFLWWSWNLCDSGAVHGVTYRRRRFCLKRKNDWLSLHLPLNLVKKERIWDIQQPSRVHFRHTPHPPSAMNMQKAPSKS